MSMRKQHAIIPRSTPPVYLPSSIVIPTDKFGKRITRSAVLQLRMLQLDFEGEISGCFPTLAINCLSQGSGKILDAP